MEAADESAVAASSEEMEKQREPIEEEEVRTNKIMSLLQQKLKHHWTQSHSWMIVSSFLMNE